MKKALGLMMVVICFVALQTQAAVYFEENFENLTVGDDVTNSTPTNYGSWDVSVGTGTSIKVVADPAGGGGKCVRIYDDTGNMASLRSRWGASATEPVFIEYDVYMPVWSGQQRLESYAGVYGEGSTIYQYQYLGNGATTGWFRNYRTGASASTLMTDVMPADTWVHVKMTLPEIPSSGYFTFHQTVTAGSTTLFDGDLTTCWGGKGSLDNFRFKGATDTAWLNVHLDNLRVVTVPEPTTLGLLAGGGLLGLLRRKK